MNAPCLLIGSIIKQIVFARKGFEKEYNEDLIEEFNTIKNIKKVPFNFINIPYYIYIEWLLIINTFKYVISKL